MISEKEEAILLKNFNRRIEKDFGKVYSLFYNDLFYFAAKLHQHTEVEPRDAIHDIFFKPVAISLSKIRTLNRYQSLPVRLLA